MFLKNRHLTEEYMLRKQMEVWRKKPLLWLRDRFGEDPKSFIWSAWDEDKYNAHHWDGDKDPLAQAWQALCNENANGHHNWAAITSATGTGKTYWLSRVVFWFLDCYKDSMVITSAPKQEQLKLHLWKEVGRAFGKFRRFRPEAKMTQLKLKIGGNVKADDEYDLDYDEAWLARGFVAGTSADSKSATKAQGFHAEHMLIIFEETAGMNFSVLSAFINTAVAKNNVILAVGNPDSINDPLSVFAENPRTLSYRVSAYDHPNIVLNSEVIAGAVSKPSIEDRKTTYVEGSPFFNSRVRGIIPLEDSTSLIKSAWIEQCTKLDEIPWTEGYNACGLDVANSLTGDMAAEAWGRGNELDRLREFRCPNATHLAYNLFYSDDELDQKGYEQYNTGKIKDYELISAFIGVDAVGIGVATINAFKDLYMDVTALQGGAWEEGLPTDEEGNVMYTFPSLRGQMWYELREDLRLGRIRINLPKDEQGQAAYYQLRRELTGIKWEFKNNRIVIEPKHLLKERMNGKSPNLADAVVYWNWTRKGYRFIYGGLGLG